MIDRQAPLAGPVGFFEEAREWRGLVKIERGPGNANPAAFCMDVQKVRAGLTGRRHAGP